jgi:hypothetical protein
LLEGERVIFLLDLHAVLGLAGTVDAALAGTLLPAHYARREARAVLLVALGLLARAEHLLLLLHLRRDVPQKQIFAADALLATIVLHTEFVFSLETGAGLPLAVLVALAGVADAEVVLLGLALLVAVGQCEVRFLVGVGVVVMVVAYGLPESPQRLSLQRLLFLQHLLVDVRFASAFETHDPEWRKQYSMKECFLERDLEPSFQLGRSRERQLDRLELRDSIDILKECLLGLNRSSIK